MTQTSTWQKIAGKWKQFGGAAKKEWGKLTDDEVTEVNGRREILAGKIQEKYGITQEAANKQIDEWSNKLKI